MSIGNVQILNKVNLNACIHCSVDNNETITDNYSHDIDKLNDNVNIVDVDFNKYDNMAFDSLRYENTTKESDLDHENESNVKCNYVTIS